MSAVRRPIGQWTQGFDQYGRKNCTRVQKQQTPILSKELVQDTGRLFGGNARICHLRVEASCNMLAVVVDA